MEGQDLAAVNLVSNDQNDAVQLLNDLSYDPVRALVAIDKRLQEEDKFNQMLREAKLSPDTDESGKPIRVPLSYSGINHTNILAGRVKIAESLLRFKYARKSETVQINSLPVAPLVIQLTDDSDADDGSDAANDDIK
jgi:hypothetical protein